MDPDSPGCPAIGLARCVERSEGNFPAFRQGYVVLARCTCILQVRTPRNWVAPSFFNAKPADPRRAACLFALLPRQKGREKTSVLPHASWLLSAAVRLWRPIKHLRKLAIAVCKPWRNLRHEVSLAGLSETQLITCSYSSPENQKSLDGGSSLFLRREPRTWFPSCVCTS
jgi:hypothetical protein